MQLDANTPDSCSSPCYSTGLFLPIHKISTSIAVKLSWLIVSTDDHYFFKKANDANCKDVDVYDGGYRKAEHPKEDKNGSDKDEGDAKTGPICKYNSIVFFRSQKYLHKGVPLKPYVQYNSQTSFLDLSQVYGNTAAKIKFLRSYEVWGE